MHAQHLNHPLVERSKREALLHAAPMLDRAIQAACGAIEEEQRNARSVSRRLQLGDAHAALLRYAPRVRAEFPQVLMQRIEAALREDTQPDPRRRPSSEDSAHEFLLRLAPTLRKKAHNYKERGMDLGELDIVAFTSLKREVLDLNSHFPPPTEYLRQGWRSLSLVGPTFARVLFAQPDAPDFLRNNLGRSIIFDVGISL